MKASVRAALDGSDLAKLADRTLQRRLYDVGHVAGPPSQNIWREALRRHENWSIALHQASKTRAVLAHFVQAASKPAATAEDKLIGCRAAEVPHLDSGASHARPFLIRRSSEA